ncbi:thioredoxin domain-containing protein [Rubellicoccus peritrichatus]|uniref:Thioredoxin domain-containing protein n=1 Tax=Rubellicoccus peritrichatus TaxID=3080537 RepID=A0AAQ3LCU7_9BACT|nr:thioredoxin domain-containing protein [Puniceicoccus sp. CR14]WOO39604.1 thioredoxin domain-containing protein [Puniceicoccus sp. CR14]
MNNIIIMRYLIASLIFSILGSVAAHAVNDAQSAATEKKEPKAYVVKVHADWCGTCRALEPRIEALKQEFKGKDVEFVTFDLTNDKTKAASKKLADSKGLTNVYKNNGKTGVVLVFPAKDQGQTQKLFKKNSEQNFRDAINKTLG